MRHGGKTYLETVLCWKLSSSVETNEMRGPNTGLGPLPWTQQPLRGLPAAVAGGSSLPSGGLEQVFLRRSQFGLLFHHRLPRDGQQERLSLEHKCSFLAVKPHRP